MHAHVLFRHEIPSGVEYRLTTKGQELVESVITLLQWMKEGERIFVGSPTVIMNKSRKMIPHMIQQKINELESEGKTVVGIFLESELAGLVAVADVLREEAKEIIDVIKGSGKDIILMSGDNERTTHAIANELGLKNVLAHVLPEDKTHEIKKLQNQGRKVAMIGDGINDAPALTQADPVLILQCLLVILYS